MSLARVLLALLAREPDHGYRLRARVAADLGLPAVAEPSHVYAALGALERAGLIRHDGAAKERGKRAYAITAAGREHLASWLDRALADRSLLRRPLLLKAAVWLHLGERPGTRLLRGERAARRRLLAARPNAPPGSFADLLRERTRRHLEIELWLLDVLASGDRSPVERASLRPRGSASR